MAKGKRPAIYREVQTEIGLRLRWARELVCPNRAEFARLLGADRSTFSKFEDGKRLPGVFMLLDAAHRLRVSPGYFLTGSLSDCDPELAARLALAHPELVTQPRRSGILMEPDTSSVTRKRGRPRLALVADAPPETPVDPDHTPRAMGDGTSATTTRQRGRSRR